MKGNFILLVLVALLINTTSLSAGLTADAGTIKGTVQATAGGRAGVVAGAKLTLINTATPNQPYKTVSNEAGEFVFSNLAAGNYILNAVTLLVRLA